MSGPPEPPGGPLRWSPDASTGPPPGYPPRPPEQPPAPPPPPASAAAPSPGGRLHPAAIAVWSAQQGVGLLLLLVLGGGPFGIGVLLVLGVLAVTVVASAIRWSRFSWRVEAGTLVIEQGLVQRSRRVIPADRVQSVDLIRPLRHRVLGVVQVRVEAIGGTDSEGQLEALDEATAFAVQHALVGARAARRGAEEDAGGPPAPSARPGPRRIAQVATGDLVVAGLTGGRVGVVALILGGVQQVVGDRLDEVFRLVPTDIGIVAGAIALVGVVLLVFGLSVVATVIAYWGFTVERDDDELRISRGLLEQRLETIPLHRIQALRIEQNVLRRAVGLASVTADVAGRAGGGGDPGTGLLLPIGPVAAARALVADLLGDETPVEAALAAPPRRSRRRYVVRGAGLGVLGAVAGASLWLAGGPAWLPVALGVLGVGVGVPLGLSWWHALGSAVVGGVLVARTGLLVRRRVHVPVGRIQLMSLRASPLQRRLDLADVHIGIARSSGWAGPRMPELDADHAAALTAQTVQDAVSASRR